MSARAPSHSPASASRPAHVYHTSLSSAAHGRAIWCPYIPGGDKHAQQDELDAQIGDVGFFDSEKSAFVRCFNVLAHASHKYNYAGVPHGFVPLELDAADLQYYPRYFSAGGVVTNGCLTVADRWTSNSGSGAVRYDFETWGDGAALIVLSHACKHAINPDVLKGLKQFVKKHARSWLAHINRIAGRAVSEKDVVLVYGYISVPVSLQIATEARGACQEPRTFTVEVSGTPRRASAIYEQEDRSEGVLEVHMSACAMRRRQVFLDCLSVTGGVDRFARNTPREMRWRG